MARSARHGPAGSAVTFPVRMRRIILPVRLPAPAAEASQQRARGAIAVPAAAPSADRPLTTVS